MAAVIVVLLLVVLLGVGAAIFFGGAVGVSRAGGSGTRSSEPDLRYPVPFGVDPAVVIDALKRDGYDATQAEDAQHQPVVHIRATAGTADREAVRSALQHVPFREGSTPADTAVRFADE